ncbi:unnamed protein product, partial [Rotaria sp. Silwood1]
VFDMKFMKGMQFFSFFLFPGLFTLDQITLSNNNNFQDEFKDYWTKKHPHEARLQRSTNELPCQCESCLGINPTDAWSLQNAVAYALNQWLDKRFTPQGIKK